mgnify:CR=1 FL=1
MKEGGPDQLMNQLSDTTTLINLIETYCVKSREEIGLTDEILEKLKTGEMASQYIMAPGQPLAYAMAEMEKLMAESGLPINFGDIAYDEDATLESMADSSFILSGVQGADLWSAFDLARGRVMTSPDIRAGIALLMAALSASGTSVIHNIEQIDRGYEAIDERLNALGAKITRQ